MCKYCEEEVEFRCTVDNGGMHTATSVKIIDYCKSKSGKRRKKRTAPPLMVVIDRNDHDIFYASSKDECHYASEYVRPISYCPWCGEQLSTENYL